MEPRTGTQDLLDTIRDLTALIRLENETLERGDVEAAAELLEPKQRALARFVRSLDAVGAVPADAAARDRFRQELRACLGELVEALVRNRTLLRTAIAVHRRIVQAVVRGLREQTCGYAPSGKAVMAAAPPVAVDRRL